MEKMNQKYICKITRRGMAFYLAILMVLVVLPLSCGGAEEPCMHYYIKRENGKDSQVSYIDYEYYDSQYHRKYCTNCGEDFGLFEHICPFGIGYDIATYVDQKTHKFYCKTCKTTVFENHVINSVDHCRYCAYSVPKEKYGKCIGGS